MLGTFNVFHYNCVSEDASKISQGSILFCSSFCELQRVWAAFRATKTSSAQDERPSVNVELSLLNLSHKMMVGVATGIIDAIDLEM